MLRYNLFHQVHKGLKALLYDTALLVQRTDFWNVEEAGEAIERITEVVQLFEEHAHTEDHFIFTFVERYEPSVADAFGQEHIKEHLLGQMLDEATEMYGRSALITEKAEIGRLIQSCFVKFMLFNIEHMTKEEDVLNPILWRYMDDGELRAQTQRIFSSVPRECMTRLDRWMIKGLNNAEITCWLKEMEKNAPAPAFHSLFTIAEKELPVPRFRLVVEGLTEGAMLA